ncbi:GNAT family N-acetyltransferase [Photobacterium sp. MCCC 1A19761]|uniref:GNAT family N-acetyltransferase n=1 Tax=Photobacterium sp. MCCC 1A19761 TaxID=3115000 RepID=UPI00307F8CAD
MKETVDAVVELDRINMAPIIAESGGAFSVSRRRNKLIEELESGSVILTQYLHDKLAGYIQYIPREAGDVYILSIQIHPEYRSGLVLKKLLKSAAIDLLQRQPKSLTSSVHRNNGPSIALHTRLGFLVTSETDERIEYIYDGIALRHKLNQFSGNLGKVC